MTLRCLYRPIAAFFSFVGMAMLAVPLRAEVVKPDSQKARIFAAALVQSFAVRGSAAVLEQIDNEAFNRRVFHESNPEERYPWARWQGVAPALKGPIQGIDAFPFPAYVRVVLDRDIRTLECEFMARTGAIQSVTFFLVEGADGAVRISDFQWGGDSMPKSQIVRHSVLMEGIKMPHLRDQEEFDLERFGQQEGLLYRKMVEAYADGKYDEAYAFLQSMPEQVKHTRICRHYLTCLDGANKQAAATLALAIRNGEPFDPLLRLRVAIGSGDVAATIKVVDTVLAARQNPPIYECLKGSLLIAEGKEAEAYRIATDTIALEPLMPFSYLVAIRASARAHPSDAMQILKQWSLTPQSGAIDGLLASFSELNAFRQSPAYAQWRQSTQKAEIPAAVQ